MLQTRSPPNTTFPANPVSHQPSFASKNCQLTRYEKNHPQRKKKPFITLRKKSIDSKKVKTFLPHEQTLQNPSVFPSFFAEGVR